MREQRIILEPFELLEVLECSGRIAADCHGTMTVKGYINSEMEEEYMQMLLEEVWATIKVSDDNGKIGTLFSGVVTEGYIEVENTVKILSITIKTGSFLMDLAGHTRTFQNKETSYETVLSVLMNSKSYSNGGVIIENGKGKSIGRFLCQYQETDWQFAMRLAGHFGTILYPNYIGSGVKFYFGMPYGKNRGEINPTEYYLKQADQMTYGMKMRDMFDIGDNVIFHGRKLYIVTRDTEFEQGELIHSYELMQSEKKSSGIIYNDSLTGGSLAGTVTKVEGTDIMVSFHEDENKAACGSRWFSYATIYSSPDGTGWYCMPEIGDTVGVYFPSHNEEEAYASNSMHMESANHEERINPDYKSLMNKQGKEILFKPDSILITNNAGMSLELSDEDGISLISDKKIVLQSESAIEITSVSDKVDIVAPQQITLSQGNTQMVLSDNLTMRGAKVRLD